MTIVQINAVCTGSTGKICLAVNELLKSRGAEGHVLYSVGGTHPAARRYMSQTEVRLQALRSRVLGNYGFNSKSATRRLIAILETLHPDAVHLHNLHGHNCHLELLFSYFRKKGIRVFWTFHDCWAFTAYCPHFVMVGCDRWKTGCHHCPQRKKFSWFFDRSPCLYERKKALWQGVDLTIITPSQWMADLADQSFFHGCDIRVINNGIDLSVFRPIQSDFRSRYHCENKKIILGVASGWSDSKGLDTFIELAGRLDNSWRCVLVGTDEQTDKRLPKNVISIHYTANAEELAQIYSAADVFFNPTKEDTYPTVNMEVMACGTPVVTYRTGGSPEIVSHGTGFVVDHDLDAAMDAIFTAAANKKELGKTCLQTARRFDQSSCFRYYIDLYLGEETT